MKIEARNVGFSYGDTPVVEDFSFSAEAGGLTGLVGPNGAGKTTLLKMLAGIARAG